MRLSLCIKLSSSSVALNLFCVIFFLPHRVNGFMMLVGSSYPPMVRLCLAYCFNGS